MRPDARLISLISQEINWACFNNKLQYKSETLQNSLVTLEWGSYFNFFFYWYKDNFLTASLFDFTVFIPNHTVLVCWLKSEMKAVYFLANAF